jgi:predicted nucleic acid-binding protein
MLLDTSGLLCLLHKDEPQNETAIELYARTSHHLTHSYALAEFVPLAQVRGLPRAAALEFSQRAIEDDEIEIVWVNELLHRQAIELLESRPDKTYSLCDAASFILMRERSIRETLTTDKHFEQEGFVRLLKP